MKRYRKKPVVTADRISMFHRVIEAFQMTKERRWSNMDWPQWLHEAWNKEPSVGAVWIDPYNNPDRERLVCGTLKGVYRIDWDDWIIRGFKGELYPCKPDIFEVTYDPVD